MKEPSIRGRILRDKLFKALIVLLAFCSILPMLFILFFITSKGISVINWRFLTHLPKPVGEIGGGISNAIIGTVMLIGIATAFSVPVGILAAIFLSENRKGRLASIIRLCVETLQGIPSIVIGIIAYIWLVVTMGSFSALSGGMALGLMMLPVIITSTEETLKLIPESLREASLSLGVSYPRTILKVILPAGVSGIMTGILLSIARVAGETAPLLFTAFGSPFMNLNILKPINNLPLMIFNYATSPYPEWHTLAWGASFILIVLVLGLNLFTKVATKRWKVQF
ncbi:MAG TPA: phosphate ABC transporter permease PstA [Thermodesulfobacteriota bacterium]|jgi:phosphate transport system permease protein|nr:phosphate ABC transporter permease PstA [Thermodesulfobacteriota bacterium]